MLHHNSISADRSLDAPVAHQELLCWTKMQAEAGQGIEAIVARKEQERAAGNGLFMWGVGNAPSVLISVVARLGLTVPVVFSLMKSKPKVSDVSPSVTLVWRRYIDRDGLERELPENVLVTSRGNADGSKKRHYALMCFSDEPLRLSRGVPFEHRAYRNASGKGAPVGASQVTSLVKRVTTPVGDADYQVNLAAQLTGSYWVRLSDPTVMTGGQFEQLAGYRGTSDRPWLDLVDRLRGERRVEEDRGQPSLLI